jgi:hypothetical protein
LTWIEIKILLREPLRALGTVGIPVLVFLVGGGVVGGRHTGLNAYRRANATHDPIGISSGDPGTI